VRGPWTFSWTWIVFSSWIPTGHYVKQFDSGIFFSLHGTSSPPVVMPLRDGN